MVEERVQRRLAAILAADMVGYSRLIETDEAGTLAHHKARRQELIDPAIAAGTMAKAGFPDPRFDRFALRHVHPAELLGSFDPFVPYAAGAVTGF